VAPTKRRVVTLSEQHYQEEDVVNEKTVRGVLLFRTGSTSLRNKNNKIQWEEMRLMRKAQD